ncbi:MAG: NADH-quinone oxidoreductase subunit J [Planctomycetes bacterium]|nr:NADH-quinone oxidoreductase subunit J [Planctomycetota bacterium]
MIAAGVFELGLFWTCCLVVIAGALGAATVRNLFHAVLLLGLSLTGVAGLYLYLDAAYLACVQIVVYVGGVLVLILFATLFSADVMGSVQRAPRWLVATGLLAAAIAAGVATRIAQDALRTVSRGTAGPAHGVDAIGGPGPGIGELLLGPWLVPFLCAGVLLTVALIGAVATVKRFRRSPGARHG